MDNSIYQKYLDFLLKGDRAACAAIVQKLIVEKIDLKTLYLDLFQTSMYEVGRLWEQNKISVATEHIATAITEGLMNLAYPLIFSSDRSGRSAIVSCVSKENHQMGAKMVADFLELNGWDAHFVGANTPPSELVRLIDEKQPDVVCLSVSLFFTLNMLEQMLDTIREFHPKLEIVVGGQAFNMGGHEIIEKYDQVRLLRSIDELEKYLTSKLAA